MIQEVKRMDDVWIIFLYAALALAFGKILEIGDKYDDR